MAKSKATRSNRSRSGRNTGRSKSGVSGSGDLRNVIKRHRQDSVHSYREEKGGTGLPQDLKGLHHQDLRDVLKQTQVERADLSVQLNNMPFNDKLGRDEHSNGISESGKQKHVIAEGNEVQKHVIAESNEISEKKKSKDKDKDQQCIKWGQRKKKKSKRSRSRS